MSSVIKAFDSYTVQYMARKPTETGTFIAECGCFNGMTLVGVIYFYPDGGPIPSNNVTKDGILQLIYEIKRFNDIITILRYEKPLQIAVDPITGIGSVYTTAGSTEPVGEQEGV